ncbi:MAG: transcriptional regulator NrdR [Candidatus Omnitrophica bacterium]|nr:transcriptional regulator NrdR [Candidatus Omnitrophota bacterium]MBU1853765.1 transcriptional regulator NrdR [Candidatus Omnitrophota bacterium]
MKCPFCSHKEDKVIDSRSSEEGRSIRRRRECLNCRRRFTTYENIEEVSLMVIKKDGRRQPFDRKKILAGIKKACEKRPISTQQLEELTDKIEYTLQTKFEKEVDASQIGELVMEFLYGLDEVAYVRFASVYRQFRDINQFMKELRTLLNK